MLTSSRPPPRRSPIEDGSASTASTAYPASASIEAIDVAGRGRLIAQGWPRMEGSDDREARTAAGEVIGIADERFSTMIADANPTGSAWARKLEQLD